MSSRKGVTTPSKDLKKSFLRVFLVKLRKRHVIETLAAFIAGGWLIIEFVDRILVAHYELNKKWLDVSFITLLGALLCILLWRWFSGVEKRPGNVKVEVLIVPLIILVALAIDLNLILQMAGILGKKLLIGIVTFLLGIAWVIFKLSQWAARTPDVAVRRFDISKLAEIKPEKSIVVLPFKNISPEEGQDYFSDGLTEELITKLSKVLSLRVISRTSAFMFKDTSKNVRDIAQELNVGYLLEGSVRKAGNKLRITAQLINATTDAHIWAETYDGLLEDVFGIQENVSHSIVDALRHKLTPEERQEFDKRSYENSVAYECYLKANQEIWRQTEDGLDRAVRYLQTALDTVGDNALLYSALAKAYLMYVNLGFRLGEGYEQKAKAYVNKALSLDPELSHAYAMSGLLCLMGEKPKEGIRHLRRAVAISPNDPEGLTWLAWIYLVNGGKTSEALPLVNRLGQVDPLSFMTRWLQGALHFYAGQYVLALPPWKRSYDLESENPIAQLYYALILLYNDRIDEAISFFDQSAKVSPGNAYVSWGTMLKYAVLDEKDKALQVMTPNLTKIWKIDATYAHPVAVALSILEEREQAIDWLEIAVSRGCVNYPLFAEKDPFFANIRSEPRFKKLMKQVKYEWEHFEE
jgi:TolB-like protein